jgi:hypothetical protein
VDGFLLDRSPTHDALCWVWPDYEIVAHVERTFWIYTGGDDRATVRALYHTPESLESLRSTF